MSIFDLRVKSGLSAADVCRELDKLGVHISNETLYKAERNGVKKIELAKGLARVYGVEIKEIIS